MNPMRKIQSRTLWRIGRVGLCAYAAIAVLGETGSFHAALLTIGLAMLLIEIGPKCQ